MAMDRKKSIWAGKTWQDLYLWTKEEQPKICVQLFEACASWVYLEKFNQSNEAYLLHLLPASCGSLHWCLHLTWNFRDHRCFGGRWRNQALDFSLLASPCKRCFWLFASTWAWTNQPEVRDSTNLKAAHLTRKVIWLEVRLFLSFQHVLLVGPTIKLFRLFLKFVHKFS